MQELRLADYNQGRRFGNASGQAGAFGTSTGFGGFGAQNTQNATTGFGSSGTSGLFGAQPSTSASPFGASTQTSGAFGGTTGGNIFGAKPATSLFGTTTSSTQPAGGIFGTSNNQTGFGTQQSGGFGSNTNTGGLFGTNTAAKPGFSFNNSGSGTSFGATGNNNNSPFGTTQPGASGFGNQQSTPAANPFAQANQTQTQSAFGGFNTNSNNNAAKPGGLFGTTPAAGSNPFASTQNNTQSTAGSLFGTGNNTATQSGTSLFGAKPATTNTGTNLFANNAGNNTGSGTGIFGGFGAASNNQAQQNQGTSVFGGNNAQKPSLFNTSGSTGTSLFGNNNNNNQQPANTSLFGSLNSNQNTQQQANSAFGSGGNSLFVGSQQQNALQPPSSMSTSIQDRNPYGSASIFNGLPPPPQVNPGPIATPISAGRIPKKLTPLPPHRLNPTLASSRYMTPPRQGYGFSYSTYGTPSSIASNASTPGTFGRSMMGSSLLGSSLSRGLGKSFSTSNLRRTYDSDGDGILSPGAFSADSMRYSGQGSLKRLTIDRSLRTDLFNNQSLAALSNPDKADQSRQQGILKKRVSFDTNTVGGNGNQPDDEHGDSGNGGQEAGNHTPSAQEQGFLRPSSRGNGRSTTNKSNGVTTQPEVEQVKGNELAIVHEDGPPENQGALTTQTRSKVDQSDHEPGNYYMRPSRDELRKMSKSQLKKFSGYTVGREGCGHVDFDQPVDLTTVDLDHLYDNLIVIVVRQLTVYPKASSKPPEGHGLNVPATITLGNSWPRARDKKTPLYEMSGPKFDKHVERLRRFPGTQFVNYDGHTGEWIFKVPHFTTYGLDYDDNDESGDETLGMSSLSPPPDTPTLRRRAPRGRDTPMPTRSAQGSSMISEDSSLVSSSVDDTFEFKKKKSFPGAFDDDHNMYDPENNDVSFLDERLGTSLVQNDGLEHSGASPMINDGDGSLDTREIGMDMAGSFPQLSPDADDIFNNEEVIKPRSILDMSFYENHLGFGTPKQAGLGDEQDWAQHLRQTISPRKQNREALRESQANRWYNDTNDPEVDTTPSVPKGGTGIVTSIDLMNSLFGQEKARRSGRGVNEKGKGLKV